MPIPGIQLEIVPLTVCEGRRSSAARRWSGYPRRYPDGKPPADESGRLRIGFGGKFLVGGPEMSTAAWAAITVRATLLVVGGIIVLAAGVALRRGTGAVICAATGGGVFESLTVVTTGVGVFVLGATVIGTGLKNQ
jgi:hypothetical protein